MKENFNAEISFGDRDNTMPYLKKIYIFGKQKIKDVTEKANVKFYPFEKVSKQQL